MKVRVSIEEAAAAARLIRDLIPGEWMRQMDLVPPAGIEVRNTGTEKGRGVYASQVFSKGQHIETCPVLIFFAPNLDSLPEELDDRIFCWSTLLNKPVGLRALCLGFGSLYNDALQPNLRYFGIRTTSCISFVTTRSIDIGEELTISYDIPAGIPTSVTGDWLRRRGKSRL